MIESQRTGHFLNMGNVVRIDNKYYFWAINCNGLFSLDIGGGLCDLRMQYEEKYYEPLLYSRCIAYGMQLIMVPYNSSEILIYDIEKRTHIKVAFDDKARFSESFSYEDWIYFLGGKRIIRMKSDDHEVEKIYESEDMQINTVCKVEKKVYFTSCNNDEIFCMDLDDNGVERYHIGDYGIHFNTIAYCNRKLWLTGDTCSIVSYDTDTGSTELFDLSDVGTIREEAIDAAAFCRSEAIDDKLILSPAKMDSFIVFDCNTKKADAIMKIKKDERCGSFIRLDQKSGLLIFEKFNPSYDVSRCFLMKDDGTISSNDSFLLPEDVGIKVGGAESEINSLNRFIKTLIDE